MGSGLGHLAAHLKDFIKNGSQIKILKIPHILIKFPNIAYWTIYKKSYIY